MSSLWQQIPTSLLGVDDAAQQAEDWANQQRQKVADTWANVQKNAINAIAQQWQNSVTNVAPTNPQDVTIGNAPESPTSQQTIGVAPPIVNGAPDMSQTPDSPNPADVLYNNDPSDPTTAYPHQQQGTPENQIYTALRQGASNVGIYVQPDPKTVTDPTQEAAMQKTAQDAQEYLSRAVGQLGQAVDINDPNSLINTATRPIGNAIIEQANNPTNPASGLLAKGLVAYGDAANRNMENLAAMYTPSQPADPNLKGLARWQSQFTPEQLAAQNDYTTNMAMGIAGGEDVAVEDAAKALIPNFSRFFHGTGTVFQTPDASRFASDALFGPGYYLTSDARIASSYAKQRESLIPQMKLQSQLNSIRSMLNRPWEYSASELTTLRQDALRVQNDLNNAIKTVGQNVRAVNVPSGLSLIDVDSTVPMAESTIRDIASKIKSSGRLPQDDLNRIVDDISTHGAMSASDFYTHLKESVGDNAQIANQLLSDAGIDGIRYNGGKRIPMRDSAGRPIAHDALNIFPESIDKLTNAISGTKAGSPPAVGGAVLGTFYGLTQGDTPQERLQNAAKYGLGGALGGYVLGGGKLPIGMSINPYTNVDPNLARMFDGFQAPVPESIYLTSQPFLDQVDTFLTRALTDNRIDIIKLEQQFSKDVGRNLNPDEMIEFWKRANPDPAADHMIRQQFVPALQQVGTEDLPNLNMYMTLRHNIEVAQAMGDKAAQKVLSQPLTGLKAVEQVNTLKKRLNMFNRFLTQANAGNDPTAVLHYQQLVADTNSLLTRANARLQKQIAAGTVSRANQAAQTALQIASDRKFAFGHTLDSSIDGLQSMELTLGPQRFANIQDAAQKVVAFNRNVLQQKVTSGIISQDFADQLNRLYPEYVPMNYIDHMIEPVTGVQGRRAALSMSDNGIKTLTAEGDPGAMEQPLAGLIRNAHVTMSAAYKNNAFNALYNVAQRDPYIASFIRQVKSTENPTRAEQIVHGFVEGAPVHLAMPRDLAQSIEGAQTSVLPFMQVPMSILRGLLASANPLFPPTHAMLTFFPYLVRTMTREGGPQSFFRVMGALGSAYIDAFKGLPKGNFGPDTEKFLAGGGGMFNEMLNYSPKYLSEEVAKLAQPSFNIRDVNTLKTVAKNIATGKYVTDILNRVDVAPRVAAMNLAERRGASAVQAINEGRTVTLDFNQGGNVGKILNSFIPFFNVAMQGTATPLRAFRDNPRAFLASAVATLATPTLGAEVWNRGDAQRAQDYNDVPNYYKDTGIVIMLPNSHFLDDQGNSHPNYIYLPTREFSPFVMLTREVAGRALGADPRSWQSLLYGDSLMSPSGGAASALIPAVTDATRLIPGGPLGNIGIAALTGINPQTGGHVTSKVADTRTGTVARAVAATGNAVERATGGMPQIQPSTIQYGLNELGGPGRLVGSIGQPPAAGQPLLSVYRTAGGQELKNAQNDRMTPAVQQLLMDAGKGTVAPAASSIYKMPLTNQEETELQQMLNAGLEQVAQQILSNPNYQKADAARKAKYVKDVLDRERQVVAAKYLQILEQRDGADTIRQRYRAALQAAS